MALEILLAGAAATGVLATVTAAGAARISAKYPPMGRFAEISGLRVHYLDVRPGDRVDDPRPPVVCIHGASSSLDEPRSALGDRLAERRVIYFDRPGHGHSERGSRGMSAPSEQARVLAGLLDHLGVDKAVIVGHSFGAAVAVAFGVLYPERVAGHVFVAPATHPWPGGVTWYYTASRISFIGRLFAWTLALPIGSLAMRSAAKGVFDPNPMPPAYPQVARIPLVLRPGNFVANALDVADLKANVIALSPRYVEITAPTIIVTGDADAVVWPSIHSEGLKRDIAGAELVTLAGVGHMPQHVRPDAVIAAIDRITERAMRAGEARTA